MHENCRQDLLRKSSREKRSELLAVCYEFMTGMSVFYDRNVRFFIPAISGIDMTGMDI